MEFKLFQNSFYSRIFLSKNQKSTAVDVKIPGGFSSLKKLPIDRFNFKACNLMFPSTLNMRFCQVIIT